MSTGNNRKRTAQSDNNITGTHPKRSYKPRVSITRVLKRMASIPKNTWRLPTLPNCIHCQAKKFYGQPPSFCCASGKISLPLPKMPTNLWNLYTTDLSPLFNHFRNRSRTYNNSSAFTSLGLSYDELLCWANRGVYTFKVQGVIRHFINDLVPGEGCGHHLQLYFYGTENELDNRIAQSENLEAAVVSLIMEIMELNPYANFFRSLRGIPDLDSYNIMLRANPHLDQRVYNLPVVDHVAAIWNENSNYSSDNPLDIRVYTKSNCSHFVHYYYGCYDPLQYPLLFPYGEPGWHVGIQKINPLRNTTHTENLEEEAITTNSLAPANHKTGESLLAAEQQNLQTNRRRTGNVSIREFYCYLFQIRSTDVTNILRTGRLIQQYQVDMYIKLETQRLDYLRHSQVQWETRSESYQGIIDSLTTEGITNGSSIGQRVVLPSSFVGGPRDLRRRYMNALALVQKYGRPDFFITMTCNPKWIEIQEELLPTEDAQNRADLLARVFKAKNEELKRELIDKKLFGEVAAYVYVIEFQKCGLPHVHWLIILKKEFKINSSEAYDRFVCSEIPDSTEESYLFSCVSNHMIHGPCGELNPNNVCMRNKICRNKYPKQFNQFTSHMPNAYPAYQRRDNGRKIFVRGHWLDNRWVVPYNPYLLAKFNCHINVEVCSDVKLVKYLYKYICKGTDKISFTVVESESLGAIDEITNFQMGRWLCAPESMWRIYGFDMYDMYPTVIQLQVHLPNLQQVCFSSRRTLQSIITSEAITKTQLTEFFSMNANNTDGAAALNLLYRDFPKYFVWINKEKRWKKREQGIAVGRLVSVNPIDSERYYLRLLLNHVKAPTSFEFLKTHNGIVHLTFREAALSRGLLDSDNDVKSTLAEASFFQMPYIFRRLFATILVYNSPSNPTQLWEDFKSALSEDILRNHPTDESTAYRLALQSIDHFLQQMGHCVDEYHLVSYKIGQTKEEMYAKDFQNEKQILVSESDLVAVENLNHKQQQAFDRILNAIHGDNGGAFFIDGPGGTGKTYLYKALLATIRSKGHIALAVATSGVAASLLPNGRTAHSRFKLPISIEEVMSCSISKQSVLAQLIVEAKLIIWDEASMAHRKVIEALDILLQDLTEKKCLFGGKTIVFGGDFRQTIPIIVGGSRQDTVSACLVCSKLWPSIQKLMLTENMRAREDPAFMDFLLRIGDGAEPFTENDCVKLPEHICIPSNTTEDPLEKLIIGVFPTFEEYSIDPFSVINRAILTPKNDSMDCINDALIERFPGNLVEYTSIDLTDDPSQQSYYQDFLNGINIGGLPPHILKLKLNCPVMLLRNLNPMEGLCNGTRLIIRELGQRIIGAVIATGEYAGKYVFIPRIPLEASDKLKCFIPFKRHQFPLRLCFAMSINKAQGQTLERVGIYLPEPVFSHGQLYVALSRAKRSEYIKVLIKPPAADSDQWCHTRNVVYKEVFALVNT